MAARKGITALAFSVLLVLSAVADAQTDTQTDALRASITKAAQHLALAKITSGARCRDLAYAMVPQGKLLTVEETAADVSPSSDGDMFWVHVILTVTIDDDPLFFSCKATYSKTNKDSNLRRGAYFSKGKP